MTDKEKIRAEIERLRKSYQIMYQELDYESPKLMSVCAKRNLCQDILMFIDYLQEEPVSEEFDNALRDVLNTHEIVNVRSCLEMFRLGSKWKAEQFEKERLKHCNELTAEQAQIESDFVTNHLKKHNRTPTFIDAIEYGMQLMKEQMMKDAVEAKVYNKAYPTEFEIETNTFMQKLKHGDKVKVIVIKEE